MQKSVYRITQMDCTAEEQLIRMKLGALEDVKSLQFDLPARHLTVYHNGPEAAVTGLIESLRLGSQLISSGAAAETLTADGNEGKLLWAVLIINFILFVTEAVAGVVAGSMGLLADSLDMLADAIVYGMALYVVGRSQMMKKKVAGISGYLQMALALAGLVEVLRRFTGHSLPEFDVMIWVSLLALTGNAVSLYILKRAKSGEAHIRASVIFTSNDVIVNIGVMVAGVAVWLTHSKYPDLVAGAIVFVLVTRGAVRILKLAS